MAPLLSYILERSAGVGEGYDVTHRRRGRLRMRWHRRLGPIAVAAAAAHITCSQAYMFAAAENIQVHGGIGFTWEHPAHLYFRRAKSSELLFGGPALYHERLLDRLGI